MMKRFWSFLTAMAFSGVIAMGTPALALDLDQARAQGMIGERADGLVGAVTNTADVAALVSTVNAARMEDYRKIATQQGTKVDAVQAIAGGKQVEKARANGWYYMDASGSWKKG